MSMTCRKHRHRNGKINNSSRTVNGVPVFIKAGTVYCDYQDYLRVVGQASIDHFCNFCQRFDLAPQG